MNDWLIFPRDPLIFRDGKPFTATPGERAKSLPFPFPSTVAGAARTNSGTDPHQGFDASRIAELLGKTVRGPVLVELNPAGEIAQWYFPAPADALLVETEDKHMDKVLRYALAPMQPPQDSFTDLTPNEDKSNLSLVGHTPHVKGKPYKKAPRYWNWETLQAWLINASDSGTPLVAASLGLADLPREHRVHVSIEPGTQASLDGALFQTSGLEYIRPELNAEERMSTAHTLAMFLNTDAALNQGLAFLGGERRVIRLQKAYSTFPACPEQVKKEILERQCCRLILATPASFEAGYLPKFLKDKYGISVQAVALSRYQTISGWDYEKGSPKLTRRLVPAGSVYFLKFAESLDATNVQKFVDAVWLKAISDDEQSRRDGFGLALLGAWDGNIREMEARL